MNYKRLLKLTPLFLLFALLGCDENIENKEVELKLAQLADSASFRLDTMNTQDWDSVYILMPYLQLDVEKHNIKISRAVKNEFKHAGITEDYCSLLFIHNQTVVAYSTIRRNIVDFSDLGGGDHNLMVPSTQKYVLQERRRAAFIE